MPEGETPSKTPEGCYREKNPPGKGWEWSHVTYIISLSSYHNYYPLPTEDAETQPVPRVTSLAGTGLKADSPAV